jgi:hypothetical protein
VKKELAILGCALMAGCVTSPPRLVNQNDSAVRFSKLGSGGRGIAQEFYDLGAGDQIKRQYWAQRSAQQNPSISEATPVEKLQRRYVNIPYGPFQDADGTLKEGGVRAVEIVQLWTATKSHGRTLNIIK